MGFETATIKTESNKEIKVLFNPAEYNLSKNVSYTDKKVLGTDNPFIQFISGEAEKLTVELMFDTYEPPGINSDEEGGKDVRNETKKIIDLMKIDPQKHRPPIVKFKYGSLQFRGVIIDATQAFTMFLADGKPVRAKLNLTFQAAVTDANIPLESPDRTKCRTLHESQSLWELAWEEYGNTELWKVIAKENHIMNPLDVKPGQKLKLPAL